MGRKPKNPDPTPSVNPVILPEPDNVIYESVNNSIPASHIHRYQDKIDAWKRDWQGFLPKVEYIFDENDRINWRKMIPNKYIVPNKDKFPPDTDLKSIDINTVDDSKLLVLLNGLRYIARLRGIRSVKQVIGGTRDFVTATCEIEFIENYEDGELTFTGEADAHDYNTHSFAKNYLTAIAGNRAFCRAIRNGLGIEILAYDEVGPNNSQKEPNKKEINSTLSAAYARLQTLLIEGGIPIEVFKNRLQQENLLTPEEVATTNQVEDIPGNKVLDIIEFTKKRIAERKKQK